jgi:glycosyltransferase involved in cell wall biosynthesis
MANGKAFVSTVVGGVADLLGETVEEKANFKIGARGVGAASEDARAFYDGLMHLAKDARLRETLGANGREFVRNNYSKERLTEDIINLYNNLM